MSQKRSTSNHSPTRNQDSLCPDHTDRPNGGPQYSVDLESRQTSPALSAARPLTHGEHEFQLYALFAGHSKSSKSEQDKDNTSTTPEPSSSSAPSSSPSQVASLAEELHKAPTSAAEHQSVGGSSRRKMICNSIGILAVIAILSFLVYFYETGNPLWIIPRQEVLSTPYDLTEPIEELYEGYDTPSTQSPFAYGAQGNI
ncbi:uncharacterized protein FIESC28_11136 [Fusarium coffeatum]|uniref:Transmembrane protein n=1 Tax=Fusarium coffeatum TaxID=231269 RepID=A0A366QMV0_9HYPO|nr:uncharacterized protein FIESC28_11136 [Fusarium coffeatum]RBR06249.1 hypothetical protein FIESC28_11136 [Fusarium coffeatum]